MVTQVTLSGRAAIHTSEGRLEPPPGKLTALLYYVAYQESWVSRDDLVYLFYPDTNEYSARQNLRPLLTTLRRLKYAEGLEIEPTRLRWNVHTDVQTFREALREHRSAQAVQQYQGVLLEGFHLAAAPEFESWLEFERNELRSSWRNASLELVADLENSERHVHAAEVLERLHKADPFDEEVFNYYLVALARGGRSQDAFKAFKTFEAMLRCEVETEPGNTTLSLMEHIRQGRIPGQSSANPWVITKPEKSKPQLKIPTATTVFIGREADIAKLVEQLGDPACRLLTIVAPGGMGKTRLALEVGEKLTHEFKDGVVFVSFEAVSSPALMVSAVANALSFSFFGSQNPKDQLLRYLETKNMLLVMDNLEHLLEGTCLITEMLQAAPALKILATSRERLDLHAEWLYDLAGMNVQDEGANAQNSDAVKLFTQTAKKARANFTLNNDLHTFVHICCSLGGMPLAIELAASWLRVLSVTEIAEELGKGIDLLESSLRDLPVRHHDIRRVFDVSWQRLSANEQTALRKLAVFQGGFTKEAAREVTDVGLPLLLALSNKSFLHRETSGGFTQHPLVWQYLREKASGDAATFAQTQKRHAEYFAAFMQEREPLLQGLEAKGIREEVGRDLANLRESWDWAVAHQRENLIDQASEGLYAFYHDEGRYHEAETLFSTAAKAMTSGSVTSGRVLYFLGGCYNYLTDYEKGSQVLQQSLSILEPHGAKRDIGRSLLTLSTCYLSVHPLEEIMPIWQRCLRLFREAEDLVHEAAVLGAMARHNKNAVDAEQQFVESIRLLRKSGKYPGVLIGTANALSNFAVLVASTKGAYQKAIRLLDEAIRIEQARGATYRIVWYLNNQAFFFGYQGDYTEAERRFREAQSLGEGLESGWVDWTLAFALYGLGWLAYLRGEPAEAKAYLMQALERAQNQGDLFGMGAQALDVLGSVALAEGMLDEAEGLHQEALHFFSSSESQNSERCWHKVLCVTHLGNVALAKGNNQDAKRYLHEALKVTRDWQLIPAALHLCVSFADLLRQRDNERRAVRLLTIAANHPASMFETKEAAKRRLEGLPGIVTKGLDRTKPLTLDQVVGEMLSS